jgi:hypothetical protein
MDPETILRFIDSRYALASEVTGKVIVWDFIDPLDPQLLYFWEPVNNVDIGGIVQIAVEGTTAYVLVSHEVGDDHADSLFMYDVSDPATDPLPVIGSYAVVNEAQPSLGGRARDLDVQDGIVYIAVGALSVSPQNYEAAQGLVILDAATDPARPVLLSSFKTHGSVMGVRVGGNLAYLFDHGEGLIILDVSDPSNPVRLGNYHSPAAMPDMVRDGDLLYVSDRWNGFSVLDVSNPADPTLVGVYQTRESSAGGGNWGIDYHDAKVYLSTGWAGFEIIDVSDPSNPVFAGAFAEPWPEGVEAADLKFNPALGDILHVCTQPGAFLVNFDVSDPGNVDDIASEFIGGGQPFIDDLELTADGMTAHAARDTVLVAIDVMDVENPTLLSEFFAPDPNVDVVDIALLEDGEGGVIRIATSGISNSEFMTYSQDVSDPANPGPAFGFGDVGAQGYSIGLLDQEHLVHARSSGHVKLWSVADPFDPAALSNTEYRFVQPAAGGAHKGVGMVIDEPFVFAAGAGDGDRPPVHHRLTGLVSLELICPNDFNHDGVLNILDFVAYQNAFVSQDENADINGDGVLNILDFVAFQEIFKNGCP